MTTEQYLSELKTRLEEEFEYKGTSAYIDSEEIFDAETAKALSKDFYKEQSVKGKDDEASEGLTLVLEKYVKHQCSQYDLEEEQIDQLASRLVPEKGIETDKDIETELNNLKGLLEK